MTSKPWHNTLRRLAACALWIGVWQVASLLVGSELLLAGPWQTCVRLAAILANPATAGTAWFSLSRIAAGFLLAFAVAVCLGIAAHLFAAVRSVAEPAVATCKSVPVACVVVLLLMWVGSDAVSGLVVFLMAFPALYLAMLEGLEQARDATHEMLVSFGVSVPRVFCAHTWQRTLPYLLATSKNACGMAWKAGVAAELIGTPRGSIGERVYQAKILLETGDLFAWTVIIVACSFACERAFVWLLAQTGPLMRRLSLWHAKRHDAPVPAPGRISLRDASIGYEEHVVAEHVALDLAPGSRTVFADPSGTGKTTLLRTMAGLASPLCGTVEPVRPLAIAFQDTRLVEELDACGNVLLANARAMTSEDARALLCELLPDDVLDRPVRELSGGQRRRVEIARALGHPSAAVLLDEPFASLDGHTHEQAAAFVLRHLHGRTLVVASHAPEDARLLHATTLTQRG